MDLSKMPNDRKLYLCKWYFKAGLVFLPFIWTVNFIWFFSEAYRKPAYEEQKQIRKYATLSGIGALIWTAIFIAWIVIFQTNRAAWGALADDISFIIPLGVP